jgi:hypothetical protein
METCTYRPNVDLEVQVQYECYPGGGITYDVCRPRVHWRAGYYAYDVCGMWTTFTLDQQAAGEEIEAATRRHGARGGGAKHVVIQFSWYTFTGRIFEGNG